MARRRNLPQRFCVNGFAAARPQVLADEHHPTGRIRVLRFWRIRGHGNTPLRRPCHPCHPLCPRALKLAAHLCRSLATVVLAQSKTPEVCCSCASCQRTQLSEIGATACAKNKRVRLTACASSAGCLDTTRLFLDRWWRQEQEMGPHIGWPPPLKLIQLE